MSIRLKLALIASGAVLISIGISFIPAASSGLPSLPPTSSMRKTLQDEPVLNALFVRPPQAAVDACLGLTHHTTLLHEDFVQIARCLHRKHFVSAKTVAAVERNQLLGATHVATLEAKTTRATWWWLLTWALALLAIAVVVYRHLRRRPPPSGTSAHTSP